MDIHFPYLTVSDVPTQDHSMEEGAVADLRAVVPERPVVAQIQDDYVVSTKNPSKSIAHSNTKTMMMMYLLTAHQCQVPH